MTKGDVARKEDGMSKGIWEAEKAKWAARAAEYEARRAAARAKLAQAMVRAAPADRVKIAAAVAVILEP